MWLSAFFVFIISDSSVPVISPTSAASSVNKVKWPSSFAYPMNYHIRKIFTTCNYK